MVGGVDGLAEPRFGEGELRVTGEAPRRAGGNLYQGEIGADGVAHGSHVLIRQAFGEHGADFGKGAWLSGDEGTGGFKDGGTVECAAAPLDDVGLTGGHDRLEGGTETQIVGGGDEVKGDADEGGFDDFAGFDAMGEVGALKVGQASPEADVGGAGKLGLQPAEVFDEGGDGLVEAGEQMLAGEGGAVDFAQGEGAGGHGRRSLVVEHLSLV